MFWEVFDQIFSHMNWQVVCYITLKIILYWFFENLTSITQSCSPPSHSITTPHTYIMSLKTLIENKPNQTNKQPTSLLLLCNPSSYILMASGAVMCYIVVYTFSSISPTHNMFIALRYTSDCWEGVATNGLRWQESKPHVCSVFEDTLLPTHILDVAWE